MEVFLGLFFGGQHTFLVGEIGQVYTICVRSLHTSNTYCLETHNCSSHTHTKRNIDSIVHARIALLHEQVQEDHYMKEFTGTGNAPIQKYAVFHAVA